MVEERSEIRKNRRNKIWKRFETLESLTRHWWVNLVQWFHLMMIVRSCKKVPRTVSMDRSVLWWRIHVSIPIDPTGEQIPGGLSRLSELYKENSAVGKKINFFLWIGLNISHYFYNKLLNDLNIKLHKLKIFEFSNVHEISIHTLFRDLSFLPVLCLQEPQKIFGCHLPNVMLKLQHMHLPANLLLLFFFFWCYFN